jgi:hypothetical protein
MKLSPLILLFTLFTAQCLAQSWSTPVNVSNMNTPCNTPKMVVDHNGTIHAVWSRALSQRYRRIMYSKSTDMGNTWSTPLAIADAPQQWLDMCDITCDPQNRLYVSYEGDEAEPGLMHIYMVIFDGTAWSDPQIVSSGYPGSYFSRVVADHTGRVYCIWLGWYANGDKIMYRYLENGVWSTTGIPYTEPNYWYFLYAVVADSSNNLHCVGRYKKNKNEVSHADIQYFSYYAPADQWSPLELVSDTIGYKGYGDICLDTNQVPHFVWEQWSSLQLNSDKVTLHRYADASGYLPVDTVEKNNGAHDHQIEIDKDNQIHIFVNQWHNIPNTIFKCQLVNYRILNNEWIGEVIDSINGVIIEPNTQMITPDQPGIIYFKGTTLPDTTNRDIFFSKFTVYTAKAENPFARPIASPNPFTRGTSLTYTLPVAGHLTIDILDINGKHIARLLDQEQTGGTHCQSWQGTDFNGKEVNKGLYYVRFNTGSGMYLCKVIKL